MPDPTRIEADYLIETAFEPAVAAEAMAGEQSSGTFVTLPGETPELKQRSAAIVESLDVLDEVGEPALPGAASPTGGVHTRRRAHVTLSWPLDNIGPSLPNLMATVAGNLFELRHFSGIRLLDIRLPTAFAERYGGPRFGMDGTRTLCGVYGRPLIGTIIKPSIGLSPRETGTLALELCKAGIDFIKDDELQSDGPSCPFDTRVEHVMRAVHAAADKTGRKTMVAFNVTGEIDEMRHRHDVVLKHGGTCVMASVNMVGMSGIAALARHSQLPIHAHRNGWGALTRSPLLGWSYLAWSRLWRLAGCDHMHVNGLDNKFCESNQSVIASARSLSQPMFEQAPMLAVPIFASGQTVRQAADTWTALQSPDLVVVAGGGILAHPGGVTSGVEAFRDAWDAAMANSPIEEYAEQHPALAAALAVF